MLVTGLRWGSNEKRVVRATASCGAGVACVLRLCGDAADVQPPPEGRVALVATHTAGHLTHGTQHAHAHAQFATNSPLSATSARLRITYGHWRYDGQ